MKNLKIKFQGALNLLKEKLHNAFPNYEYKIQLEKYQMKILS